MNSSKTTATGHPPKEESRWQTTPWVGLLSLAALVVCAIIAAVVVGISHDDEVSSWSVAPAVLLAILSAASNIAFGSALATGIVVRFWRYAARGATPSQLHYIWDHGRGFGLFGALRAGSEARTVALMATLAYITQFASGPLLQRSTDQAIEVREAPQTLNLDLAAHIPDGWLGVMENGVSIGFRKGITEVQQNFRNTSMRTRDVPGYACAAGTCHGVVRGAGLSASCSTTTQLVQMNSTDNNGLPVFAINATMLVNGVPFAVPFVGDGTNNSYHPATDTASLRLFVLHASSVNESCVTTLTIDTCDFRAAVVEYPVTIRNSTITLQLDKLTQMNVVSTTSSPNDLPTAPNGTAAGLLSSLRTMIDGNYATNTTKLWKPQANVTVYGGDGSTLPDKFFLPESPSYADGSPTRKCALTWDSPTEYVLRELHTFVFRCALRLGAEQNETQTVDGRRAVVVAVYQTDPRYLGAAMAAMVVSLGLVAALMRGWWRLPRPVTLSPLETAGVLRGVDVLEEIAEDVPLKKVLKRLERVETGLEGSKNGSATVSRVNTGLPGPQGGGKVDVEVVAVSVKGEGTSSPR
ncbi:hypothetical protein QBC47DRAFT_297707 [Echria macrotheca]|uniref:Uncharacterized protein n=1 Tax=Echria macrotheca TaxID=438768 RepID=A0AAJ0FD40_9PEZI|nr:hypothetical protein QBC47DRAFT_297707 [Echria macrotheca]